MNINYLAQTWQSTMLFLLSNPSKIEHVFQFKVDCSQVWHRS